MNNSFDFIKKFKIHISSGFLMVVFTVLGLYYSFSFVPGRETYSTLATNLVYARSALQDENNICSQDPQLRDTSKKKDMDKAQDELATALNKIDALSTYDRNIWGPQTFKEVTIFSKWAWDQYFQIKYDHKCPTNKKTNDELRKWVSGIISQFPHYIFF